jgi:hypothetical protein
VDRRCLTDRHSNSDESTIKPSVPPFPTPIYDQHRRRPPMVRPWWFLISHIHTQHSYSRFFFIIFVSFLFRFFLSLSVAAAAAAHFYKYPQPASTHIGTLYTIRRVAYIELETQTQSFSQLQKL